MKLILAVLAVLLVVSGVQASPFEVKSLSLTVGTEMNPADCTTDFTMFDLKAASDEVSLRLTHEIFSDGSSRDTVYASPSGSLTSLAVRFDSIDRLWLGLNHVQPITKELTLVVRPLLAANDNTTSRVYVFADYSAGDKLGLMAASLAMPGYNPDIYVGPTWRDKNLSLYAAPSLSKNDCWYWEASVSFPL